MKRTISIVLALALLLSLCACGSLSDRIVGRWEYEDEYGELYYEFFEDGTFTSDDNGDVWSGEYSVEGNRLHMEIGWESINCDAEVKGSHLTITPDNDEAVTFTRVR